MGIDKEPTPPPAAKTPYRKSTTGAPGEVDENGGFKMKKRTGPRKILPKEEEQPAFAGMKLKKSERVQRKWDDGGLETVDLKHHAFEKVPLDEDDELGSETWITEPAD